MTEIRNLNVQIFADGADLNAIRKLATNPLIKGFTTNPTLMRNAGVDDYEAFALEVLSEIKDRPVSFEVFSDDLDEMAKQGHKIASWGDNVYVKIPITNTIRCFDCTHRQIFIGCRGKTQHDGNYDFGSGTKNLRCSELGCFGDCFCICREDCGHRHGSFAIDERMC